MGYSVAAPIRSHKAKAIMLAFLRQHYRPWSKLTGQQDDYISEPTGDLSYDRGKKLRIGFDCNAGLGGEREYAHAICRWMALKVGRLAQGNKFSGHPYIVYDGHASMPVLFEDLEGYEWAKTDRVGFKDLPNLELYRKLNLVDEIETALKEGKIIKDELDRLDNLWEQV